MKSIVSKHAFPELFSNPTSHKFVGDWDSLAVARIIKENSGAGNSPAFLFLGRSEAELLRVHLGNAYGEEAVPTLNQIYYMGLKVVTIDAESYICTGGSKSVRPQNRPSGLKLAS